MATRSTIGLILDETSAQTIYCHFDGHPSHHLPILEKAYATVDKVRQLIALGDLSVLDVNIGNKINFNDYDARDKARQCLAYGRDREERNTRAQFQDMRDAIGGNDYTYLFDPYEEQWRVWQGSKEITKPRAKPQQGNLDLDTDPANGGI